MKATYKIVNEKNRQTIRRYYEKYSWYKLDREELTQELLIRGGFLAILTWLLW
ncbi:MULTISPECIES: hypothetical protein [Sphingobacterium]|jgi:hypothetical protein|uniref:hypothetical protein n=1 Tax=Sphingobacterium TaxID=28453 RepID=UPI00129CA95A|nr:MULTISPECIES: hypothetical protein [Sphingobacterium]MCS4163765.1 hypothetical protein [Sphingobacterium sp. BIGb0116]